MDGLTLLAEARTAGLEVHAKGDRLVVRGPKFAEPLALRLIEHKAELLPLLSVEQPDQADWRESELQAAEGELDGVDSEILILNTKLLGFCGAKDWPAAKVLQAEIADLVEGAWLPARRRLARALDRLGRLSEADRFLLVGEDSCVVCGSLLALSSRVLC